MYKALVRFAQTWGKFIASNAASFRTAGKGMKKFGGRVNSVPRIVMSAPELSDTRHCTTRHGDIRELFCLDKIDTEKLVQWCRQTQPPHWRLLCWSDFAS